MNKLEEFKPIFFPKTHAIIGASNTITKFGGRYVRTQINFGYKGRIIPVNNEEPEVFGMKAYPSVTDIPEPVDFASILVPSSAVVQVLEECLQKGIKGAQIVTSGFSELNEQGREWENQISAIAARGIRVIGPNCFGVYCPRGGITMLPGEDFPKESGNVACMSQSGSFGVRIPRRADGLGIRFSKLISFGNASDINECDLLEYFYEDPETKIIIAYLEGLKNGRRFFELLKKVTKEKPVIIWKGGLTEGGARAVQSHTASMSGQKQIWDALFKQTGAISVNGLDGMMDAALAFLHLPPIRGRKFCLVGGGGGISVAASDICERAGILLPVFSGELQQKLAAVVPPQGASVRNPIDGGSPVPAAPMLQAVLEIIFSNTDLDGLIVSDVEMSITAPFQKTDPRRLGWIRDNIQITQDICKKYGKPLIMVLPQEHGGLAWLEYEIERRRAADAYLKNGVPVFLTLERAADILSKFINYWEYRDSAR